MDVDYIGYVIKNPHIISIREKNIQKQLGRLSRIISRYRNLKNNTYLRPPFIAEEMAFDEYYISLINENIAGRKIGNHLYGWLPYFQAMTDLHTLYMMDNVVHKKFLKGLSIENKILHLPNVYWDIKKYAGKNTLFDYDNISTPAEMRCYLLRRGLIRKDVNISNAEIQVVYDNHKEHQKHDAQKSIGTTY